MAIENPNIPHEWFNEAKDLICDEGVFSEDQVRHLTAMVEHIEGGVTTAIHNAQRAIR